MNNVLGLAVFALGIVLLILGLTAAPDLQAAFSSRAPHDASWLVAGGAAAVILGFSLAVRGIRRD